MNNAERLALIGYDHGEVADYDAFAIYHAPRDLGWEYVVRGHSVLRHCGTSESVPWLQPLALVTSLEAARAALRLLVGPGLVNIGRYNQDDPVLVEVWI